MILKRNIRYLQIALNGTLDEARKIIAQLPFSNRILIEAGTPFIKIYGVEGIRKIKAWWIERVFGLATSVSKRPMPRKMEFGWAREFLKKIQETGNTQEASNPIPHNFIPYLVADMKCADLGQREVKMAAESGADAATCLGVAPAETIDFFVEECSRLGIDSMIDMMNVETPTAVLKSLKKIPDVVILHRGVDEETFNPEKDLPVNEIQTIKNNCDALVSVAGGDTFDEVQRAVFNDADIVVVWKSFYKSTSQTAQLARQFLKEIR
jgi:3-keto-L-gulonate-6-phosphate decarboxylase